MARSQLLKTLARNIEYRIQIIHEPGQIIHGTQWQRTTAAHNGHAIGSKALGQAQWGVLAQQQGCLGRLNPGAQAQNNLALAG